MPKLDLPKFSGDLLEWKTFHDRFVASVHSKQISECLKFEYLSASLLGEAAECIRNIPITDANYLLAWDLLKKRFQNNRKNATLHVKRLLKQPAVGSNVGEGLRRLVYCTNECIRALRVLGLPVDTWDFMVCTVVEEKLDSNTKRQWELTFDDDRFPVLDAFLNFLEKHARSFDDDLPSQPVNKAANQPKRNKQSLDSNVCNLCKDTHPTFTCPQLSKGTYAEKQELLKRARLCFNCLLPGYSAGDCPSGTCKKCNGKHNTVLHDDSRSVVAAAKDQSANLIAAADDVDGDDSRTLLKTAVVNVQNVHGNFTMVRSLLDSGSHKSHK